MSDIPVFLVVNLAVQDAAEYRKYEKGFFPILKRYAGEFVTYDDNPDTFDGTQLAFLTLVRGVAPRA